MKHQAISLVKFKSLQRSLKIPSVMAIGLLEGIWLFAQHNARDGDLSKFSPDEIAGWIEWPGDAAEMIEALVKNRWLDRDGSTLMIHDWEEHKPNWLKGVEGRFDKPPTKKRPSSAPSTEPSSEPSSAPSSAPSTEPSNPHPNLTKPNLTKPNPIGGDVEKISEEPKPIQQPPRPILVRPPMPCDYPELVPAAKKVVDHYQAAVRPAQSKSGAEQGILARMVNDEYSVEQLIASADHYAEWCRKNNREAKYRKGAASFFGDGGAWKEFLQAPPPTESSLREESRRRAAETRAKMDEIDKNALSLEDLRKSWSKARGHDKPGGQGLEVAGTVLAGGNAPGS